LSGNHDFTCSFFIKTVVLHEFLIICHGEELQFIIRVGESGVIEHVAGSFCRVFHFRYGRDFTVNSFTDIIQHIPVVGLSSVGQITSYQILLYAVQITNVVGRVGSHGSVYRDTFIRCLLYLLTLLFDNTQSHAIDEYHVIIGQTIEIVKRHFTKFNE
jgi:hypothetical protein